MENDDRPLARCKYVVFTQGGGSFKDFLIFPETISHDTFEYLRPTSAGFCRLYHDKETDSIHWDCYGKSTSLGISMVEEDNKTLNRREI